ncbi:hypothetical protein ES703_11837 [subsurface metagenome]
MEEKETNINEVEQLRQFKKKSRWSYEKIGKRMGIHPQTIVFWITGKHSPSKMAKEKIQRFLDEYFINSVKK